MGTKKALRQHAKAVFIGPVQPKRGTTHRVTGYCFYMLQAGGDPIEFNYPTEILAKKARNTLAKADYAHKVGDPNLLQGINLALKEAMAIAVNVTLDMDGDET